MFTGTGWAANYCELGPPALNKSDSHYRLSVTVKCSQSPSGVAVEYPEGILYVGASLYRLGADLAGKIVPFVTPDSDTQTIDLAPVELHMTPDQAKISFDIDALDDSTHVLIVIWDKKNPCSSDNSDSAECQKFGYTLGRVDEFGMPIPIDTWPRPICHRERLSTDGFFSWVEQAGDPSGHAMPEGLEDDYSLNDCWSLIETKGLGFSVRRWRVGPLPKFAM
jgi:hypothetical protein